MFKAKRKIELFEHIDSSRQLDNYLNKNREQLIFNRKCNVSLSLTVQGDSDDPGAEIYCEYAGWCTALESLFTFMKLDWSNGEILLLKVSADENEKLVRFQNQSEPVFLFIYNRKVISFFRGVNKMKLAILAKREIDYYFRTKNGEFINRPTYELDEPLPEEYEWLNSRALEDKIEVEEATERRHMRQAERKKYRAQLMVPFLTQLNFVLFWPHAKHAHPELYEHWDVNNIVMVAREEIKLTEEVALDILYAGDAPINEASIHALLNGKALVICFRLLDDDVHFVSLVRRILYEDIPTYDDTKPASEQKPKMTAFNRYKTFSLPKDKILEQREQAKEKKKMEIMEKRARRLSEMQRLARQAIQEAIQEKQAAREQLKLELLKTGNLEKLKELEDEPLDDRVSIEVPEELPDNMIEEEVSDEEDTEEFFPAAGLVIPGFYSPPNDIAKANGLAILFPKTIQQYVTPQPEFLPPHILIMLSITKRFKAIAAVTKYKKNIIHMGVFRVKNLSPYKTSHIAYTVSQFENLGLPLDEDIKLVFMMSTQSDLGALELVDLGPDYVSRNEEDGEEECSAVFPVDYGYGVNEMQDFEEIFDDE